MKRLTRELTMAEQAKVKQWVNAYLADNVAEVTRDRQRYEERCGRRLGGAHAIAWKRRKARSLHPKAIEALGIK